MRFLFTNIKYQIYKIIAFAFLSLMVSGHCFAQSVDPLPDSVSALEDTVIASDSNVSASDSQKIDVTVPDTVVFRSVPDSVISRYKKDKDFAYANDAAYWTKEPVSNDKDFFYYFLAFITSKGVRIFVYLLIAAVLLFAFYKIIIENKLYLFYAAPKKLKAAEIDDLDLQSEDFDEKIGQAMQAMDYRLAIRYMYLKVLRLLDDKQLIHFHAQGTNQEYVSQLNMHDQGKTFKYLTNVYEYVWYGGFVLTAQQTEILQQNFNQFYSAIES